MSKPVLLLLPGLLCDHAVWGQQIQALSTIADCVVPRYSELDSIPAMAQAALRHAPPRFALAGHSMGGRVALEIMRSAAHRVTHLALLDTGYHPRLEGETGEAEARRRRRLVDLAASRGMTVMGREWVREMVHPERLLDGTLIDSILEMIARQTPEMFAAQIRALLNRPDASDVLPTVTQATLLLCGRQDAWSPLARHEAMARLIANSRLQVIEESGHMTTMEQPVQVSTALRAWLSEKRHISDLPS
jgi:pimeloyl-ACP methyl ester carboxylesterase